MSDIRIALMIAIKIYHLMICCEVDAEEFEMQLTELERFASQRYNGGARRGDKCLTLGLACNGSRTSPVEVTFLTPRSSNSILLYRWPSWAGGRQQKGGGSPR